MNGGVRNIVWKLAVDGRDWLKRSGLSGPLEPALMWLGPRLMPPPKDETEVLIADDVRLVLPARFPSYRNYLTGTYERDLRVALDQLVTPGMRIADVGANVGYYTVRFARSIGPEGSVTAFEPDPVARAYLSRNLALNGCVNVTVVPAAAASTSGEGRFLQAQHERGRLTLGPAELQVATTSLDDYFCGIGWPTVDLVKMDIEGGESDALAGMHELVRRNPELVLAIEYSSVLVRRGGGTPAGFRDSLIAAGFRFAHIVEQAGRPVELCGWQPRGSAMVNLLVTRNALTSVFAR